MQRLKNAGVPVRAISFHKSYRALTRYCMIDCLRTADYKKATLKVPDFAKNATADLDQEGLQWPLDHALDSLLAGVTGRFH